LPHSWLGIFYLFAKSAITSNNRPFGAVPPFGQGPSVNHPELLWWLEEFVLKRPTSVPSVTTIGGLTALHPPVPASTPFWIGVLLGHCLP
jgi:hypothetical protein